jgi:hypothetical protein
MQLDPNPASIKTEPESKTPEPGINSQIAMSFFYRTLAANPRH